MANVGLFYLKPEKLLEMIKSVDGAGSGLDADLLDGKEQGEGGGLDADTLDGEHKAFYTASSNINFDNSGTSLTATNVQNAISELDSNIVNTQNTLNNHVNNTNNPHGVTAAQLGASNILDQIKTVDGEESGLDADLWRGYKLKVIKHSEDKNFSGNAEYSYEVDINDYGISTSKMRGYIVYGTAIGTRCDRIEFSYEYDNCSGVFTLTFKNITTYSTTTTILYSICIIYEE